MAMMRRFEKSLIGNWLVFGSGLGIGGVLANYDTQLQGSLAQDKAPTAFDDILYVCSLITDVIF